MLAQPAADVDEALAALGEAALEWKLDGARVQVHKDGEEVRVFSRALRDVTPAVPEVVEAVRRMPASLARARRRGDRAPPGRLARAVPGDDAPLRAEARRRAAQRRSCRSRCCSSTRSTPTGRTWSRAPPASGTQRSPPPSRTRCACRASSPPTRAAAAAFLEDALARGHEGLMAKALDAPYEAGRRGASWLKVKRAHTLDLVVLAAEWGNGRRRGWLSNLHLGARDPAERRLRHARQDVQGHDRRDARVADRAAPRARAWARPTRTSCHVRPELVVEVAFDGLQASPRYPAGLALRFARVKRYRDGQAARGRRHDRDGAGAVRAAGGGGASVGRWDRTVGRPRPRPATPTPTADRDREVDRCSVDRRLL